MLDKFVSVILGVLLIVIVIVGFLLVFAMSESFWKTVAGLTISGIIVVWYYIGAGNNN